MDAYEELTEKIGKWKRNEAQMSEEQRKKYAKQLEVLHRHIRLSAAELMKEFLFMGVRIWKEDGAEANAHVMRILKDELDRGLAKKALAVLYETYSVEAFLLFLCPAHDRIFHEGYGPYWASHCVPVETRDEETAFSYYNDIIDFYWSEEWGVWKKKGEWAIQIMLPPTIERIKEEYRREFAGEETDDRYRQKWKGRFLIPHN